MVVLFWVVVEYTAMVCQSLFNFVCKDRHIELNVYFVSSGDTVGMPTVFANM